MSNHLSVGVTPGAVPVNHNTTAKVFDRRIRITELVLRCVTLGLGVLAAVLVGTDSQVKVFFSIQKTAKFTDMKALVFLVVANGLAAGYSLLQGLRCIIGVVRGRVLLSKPLAWAIFSGDQVMAYITVGAVATAAQSGMLAKVGQPELQWMELCNMYGKFCNQVGEGIASAFVVSLSTVVLSCISAFSLFRLYGGYKIKNVHCWYRTGLGYLRSHRLSLFAVVHRHPSSQFCSVATGIASLNDSHPYRSWKLVSSPTHHHAPSQNWHIWAHVTHALSSPRLNVVAPPLWVSPKLSLLVLTLKTLFWRSLKVNLAKVTLGVSRP
ncbi:unnamed protein product [Sphenostylis stenocarpa]|uniref:CASP-like protein n=1 Tax=Sphenostylis stenocarpa TaxID=92480 RepID=A0AA86VP23_9FABA|nr:unnamed protein product [Sphenostylis stenocarpa]